MDAKKSSQQAGFMPRRINAYSKPSSFAIRTLRKESALQLEKIWEEQANLIDDNTFPSEWPEFRNSTLTLKR